ncbi:DUF2059 domain-containing protein [Rhodobacteraceae bacterium M382]|nr:DUF2059 domain-containing protein [Rhodobacteraceae bacterium M382]
MTYSVLRLFRPAFVPFLIVTLLLASLGSPGPARAADKQKVEAFLVTTGFDTALESIKFSAASAPDMLGLEPGQFGTDWARLAKQVFDVDDMHQMAVEFLIATLDDDMLGHAVDFYETDLGQRLVAVENAAHLDDADDVRQTEGTRIVQELQTQEDATRFQLFHRLVRATDASGIGARALQEIQIRFLLTASAAGVIELRIDEQGLRALMKESETDLKAALTESGLAASAYTYRDFDNTDLETYVKALEQPLMQKVYELLNAVQYEVTANRFEVLAVRMAKLHPGQDI